jgi:hypothetical protein
VSKAKKVVFVEEDSTEDTSGLEELAVEPINEEEIESLFTFEPIQVTEVKQQESTIEVTPLRDFKSSFGGQWYFFVKGRTQKVPIALRDFLLNNKNEPKIKDIW